MAKNSVTVAKLKKYISNDLNVLISGPAGTGKTSKVLQACDELGLVVKYYSAPTLDPYVDLIGVPVPNHDTKNVEFWRPHEIDEAEVVIFDETNRAPGKTQNTIFEITQFKTINGEKLDKLKCVISMINPHEEGYRVDDMDIALVDRFDIQLQDTPTIDVKYFRDKYGKRVAEVAKTTWSEYHDTVENCIDKRNRPAYMSPRRMDKIIGAYMKVPELSTIEGALPTGVNLSSVALYQDLKEALHNDELEKSDKKVENTKKKKTPVAKSTTGNKTLDSIINLSVAVRHKDNVNLPYNFMTNYNISDKYKSMLVSHMMRNVLHSGVSPSRMVSDYDYIISKATKSDLQEMTRSWSESKMYQLYTQFWDAYILNSTDNQDIRDFISDIQRRS